MLIDPYTVPALPTTYANTPFKSKLEAQTALFFDLLRLEWQYEPVTFDLGYIRDEHIIYKPDFFLSGLNRWIEVKGPRPYELAILKADLLARRTLKLVQIWSGSMGCQTIYNYVKSGNNRVTTWQERSLDRMLVDKAKIKSDEQLARLLWLVVHHKF